ncbi:putative C2 and GRAM domain-containing protein-like [Capsicum annuum]|nr:putative C2 and GRAM domain-containing protein-like [Capsicum annuum]
MSDFTLIILRWYHGGVLDLSSGEPVYKGGKITEFLDVDVDKMSYFELRDYIRKLGYSTTCTFSIKPPNSGILVDMDSDVDIFEKMCSLENRDEVDVFVKNLVDKPIVVDPPIFLENGSLENMEESGASFDNRPNFMVGEDHINEENLFTSFSTLPPCTTIPHFTTADSAATYNTSTPTAASSVPTSTTTPPSDVVASVASPSVVATSVAAGSAAAVDGIHIGPAGSDFSEEEVEGSDYSTEDSVELEGELVGDDDDEEYVSDVHEEVMELRSEKRKFQRRKRKERVSADNAEVPVGKAGPDLGFDDTETGKVSHEGRRSIKLSIKKRPTSQKIIHEPTAKEVVWQLGMAFKDVNEFRRAVTKYAVRKRVFVEKWVNGPKKVRVRCKDGCLWLLYAGLDNTTNGFIIKTYIQKHTCNKITRNYLRNAKFFAETFRERIIENPNIKVFNLQELIRKKFKLYVSKTTVRRARTKVLKDTMGDHAVEFGRILDYKEELLRTNPGTSCVVKLGEANEEGVCKGRLLVAVGKDGNNQMLPLAWTVVEKENTNTWSWFVRCIKDDLGLGEGEGLTLIKDMQKGLFTAIEQVLPQSEFRRYARHILANWAKEWRGLCQHKVDIVKRTCSCRVCKLKGIPCAHGVAAILFKKYPLYEYIDSCYSKETYLQTYANVPQPLTNMKMWPVSSNIVVAPPEITTLPRRPAKNRKKEVGKTKKSGKLPRTGLEMTCSVCHIKGHNKRGCPHRAPSAEPTAPAVATDIGSGRERGRPKKTPPEAPNAAPQGKSNGSGRGRGRPKKTSSEAITEPPQGKKGRGRPKRTISVGATATPLPTAPPVHTIFPASSSAPSDFCTSSSIAGTTKREIGSGKENTAPFKRVMDYFAWFGCIELWKVDMVIELWKVDMISNPKRRKVHLGLVLKVDSQPGMPSSKIYSNGQVKVARSIDVTGDIGYTPSSTGKLKWNGKSAISTRKLQELKENRRKKKVGSSSNHPSQNTASSQSNMP